jgi:hypothetical protein
MNYDPILHESFNGALHRQQELEQLAQQSLPARLARLQAEAKAKGNTTPRRHLFHWPKLHWPRHTLRHT